MFKTEKRKSGVCLLAMGLNDSEKQCLEDLYSGSSTEIVYSDTDLDMWDHADHEKYDLCIMGQNEENEDMNYATWLLKGIIKTSKIIVVTHEYSRQEWKHLRRHKIRFILNRPLDPDQLHKTIEKALLYNKPWYIRLISWIK